MARKVLTPQSSPLYWSISLNIIQYSEHPLLATPHISFWARAPSFCSVESPILGTQGVVSCSSLPPFYFAWCPLSLGIQASGNSCSCYPCLQLLLKHRAAWFSGAPSQDWFFSFILENFDGLCQLWAQCQLPPVCPWCFCLGTLCTQAPAESHTLDNSPVIPPDGFSHHPTLLCPSGVPYLIPLPLH